MCFQKNDFFGKGTLRFIGENQYILIFRAGSIQIVFRKLNKIIYKPCKFFKLQFIVKLYQSFFHDKKKIPMNEDQSNYVFGKKKKYKQTIFVYKFTNHHFFFFFKLRFILQGRCAIRLQKFIIYYSGIIFEQQILIEGS